MEKEQLVITDSWKVIDARHACFDGSKFVASGAERMYFEDVSLKGVKIVGANLSLLEIDGAQMGGAYIHNIGVPNPGEPHFHPDTADKPVRFEKCNFTSGSITECNLSRVEIDRCEMQGMRINGIPVEDLLQAYEQWKK